MPHRSFFIGPALSLSLFGLAVVANVGAGMAFLALALVVAFAVAQPLIQFFMMNMLEVPMKPWRAWSISFVGVLVPVVAAVLAGTFNFW